MSKAIELRVSAPTTLPLPERWNVGFAYVLAIPLIPQLFMVWQPTATLGGYSLGGWTWVAVLLAGGSLAVAANAIAPDLRNRMHLGPWPLWVGFVWLSLLWADGVGMRNVQMALQMTLPVLIGVLASLFVRSEYQLRVLLKTYLLGIFMFGLGLLVWKLGYWDEEQSIRSAALTMSLVGCVAISGFPTARFWPLFLWCLCVGLVGVSGSRTATMALLLVPVLHPLLGHMVWRTIAVGFIACLSLALFYSPVFQQRFFEHGSGSVSDLMRGDYLSFGRFELWPLIWEASLRHPVIGNGVGASHALVEQLSPGLEHPHNDYLRVLYELGFVGLGIFVAVLLWQFAELNRRIRESAGVVRQAFVAAFLGFAILVITCVTDNTLIYNQFFVAPLFALLGAAFGAWGGRQEPIRGVAVD